MITIKNLTVRNFLSSGNVTQAVKYDQKDITLILGENLDQGGDSAGSRNGTGKSLTLNAISYGLYGNAITNIRKDNLINRTNTKNMLVTIEFSKDGIEYKIERGRKPNVLKFYIGDVEQETKDDNSQGDSRETQNAIEKILGMSHDMFRHIVALNTYTEPFLSLKAQEQRAIIEQLLGITLLSEKADALKEQSKINKDAITSEEYRIKGVEEANKRVAEQIESLKRRQYSWLQKTESDLLELVTDYEELTKIDITAELLAHKELAIYKLKEKQIADHSVIAQKHNAWVLKNNLEITELKKKYDELSHVDIAEELALHKKLAQYNNDSSTLYLLSKDITRLESDIKKENNIIAKLSSELELLREHKCYACGQDFHDEKHNSVLDTKVAMLETALKERELFESQLAEKQATVFELPAKPVTYYKTEGEAIKHSSELSVIEDAISTKQLDVSPFLEQFDKFTDIDLGNKPITHYSTEEAAIRHSSKVTSLLTQIESKNSEEDPYAEQIIEMTESALVTVDYTVINELIRIRDHQEFLLKLLTNKDSFVRKKIIDQNLSYLNSRLSYYLDKIGLPHNVIFKNDLTVEITELGRELDFYNLSRGEMNRLILSLSFAFRDVWESLFQPINLLYVDELLDSGLDSSGMESTFAILKKMCRDHSKSIWLISHRDELVSRVNQVLKVTKENGFTSFSSSNE